MLRQLFPAVLGKATDRMVHVQAVRALEDNFMYIVRDENSKKALLVDPVEPKKIIEVAEKNGLEVVGALITHHHWDHAGGTPEFRKVFTDSVPIYGGDARIEKLDKHVEHNQKVTIEGLEITSLSTPCHTKGHICYHISSATGPSVVFTGDTLFIAGCGKFFEGIAEQMHKNLNEILSALPDETKVYPGHEYTVSNLKFAQHVEPSNKEIAAKLAWASSVRSKDEDTVPSTIGEEKAINPFMRVATSAEVQKFTGTTDLVKGMDALRNAKNNFRP